MRIRVARGFSSVVSLPGIDVESAVITTDGGDLELDTADGAVRFAADTFKAVDSDAGMLKYTMLVNGDTRIAVDVIANPNRPNRR